LRYLFREFALISAIIFTTVFKYFKFYFKNRGVASHPIHPSESAPGKMGKGERG